ncbi:MAG: FAD synthase, partial [Solirubrobacterales bacterium]
YQTVVDVRPDIIALGHDQTWNEKEVEAECARRGVPAKVQRLKALPHDDLATRRIVERILDRANKRREDRE